MKREHESSYPKNLRLSFRLHNSLFNGKPYVEHGLIQRTEQDKYSLGVT